MSLRSERIEKLKQISRERVLILDGSWGVMFQKRKLDEADYRGERFQDHPGQLKGNNDILCLTRPDIVGDLHDQYYAAGADISETNTFSATTIAQADYELESAVRDINFEGARIARERADAWTAREPHKPRFVAGSVGPLNKMLSMSSDVNDPGARLVTFDEVYVAYREQMIALHDGGVDMFLIETITDTLNCKAAIKVILDMEDEGYEPLPIWISGTITDRSGRTLSGQTVEAFWNSVKHAKPFAIGLNCALGADLMRPHIAELSRVADTLVSAYPNAGLPNAFGEYDEEAHQTAHELHEWASRGLVNILGGCCGTTPDHIRHVAEAVKGVKPRQIPERPKAMRLAGLEPFELA
ncbi:MAG: homocysteine S-methyltransferase family protein [Phenylobacterium sp.]|uniref:homocysteine S-methyltransferase family protein n=1 Tax=Phenylobacterium sp. TaxID=1871053 RepID=UPI002731DEB1|nr:homocysteine S-methyltransferase family protein [Phenylobacterium sp.]MDP2008661.1 homocysteine S-methyltransferase family protein [Phenylobacterium sp.]MDP3712893.1 homocysteine S-methyltransferase family protein [Mycobacteriales bacterium]MDP3867035.1 homocysteine S-methyltransferase family protein [Phenylobacterium sp.]HQT53499.1 homocysteine S-methyltransferase family protein [Phenylobacterium sp.]